MTDSPEPLAGGTVLDDCWNRIGVHGDRSCPELIAHVHCRNCPVYAAGAAQLLNHAAPGTYLAEWTEHLAVPNHREAIKSQSIVIFRVGREWLALPTTVVIEVANLLPIHSLPHRRTGAVLGLASVRGELLVCISLAHIVGVDDSRPGAHPRTASDRLLVIHRDAIRAVCPVDEVHGIHRFQAGELKPVPTTVAHAPVSHSTSLLSWQGHEVGLLDPDLLFRSVQRSLS